MSTPAVQELRDSFAFKAGICHERRRIAERILQRAWDLRAMTGRASFSVRIELRRLAAELEEMV
jgi:hypothetical protein